MYLKSLEIFGFKSFATKTHLEFHRGVTAVVGPNGCGKSNVLDAIRWVLGEQSAKALRGGEMADVIFSGTDSRKPHNMAEVTLTFAECEKELGVDWNELAVSRRVFRDGKSDYRLNGKSCRLRDIHELFMDTGIGRSAYSIMEQGKLDQILSSRPDDRRTIFEEAAGITKFKSQKKEALRKLDHTEANLLRLTDIIKEVKRQIGSLQRQAAKAKRYQRLQSELRTLDSHLCYHRYQKLQSSWEQLQATIQETHREQRSYEHQQNELEKRTAELQEETQLLELEMETGRREQQRLENQIFSAEHRLTSHQERKTELQERITHCEEEIFLLKERIEDQTSQLTHHQQELQLTLERLQSEEVALKSKEESVGQHELEKRQLTQQIAQAEVRLRQSEGSINHLQNAISMAQGRLEGSEQRLGSLQADTLLLQENLTTQSQAHTEAIQQLEQSKIQLEQHQGELERLQEEQELARQHAQELELAWNQHHQKITEKKSRLELLCQLEKEGAGLGEGTQALLRGLDEPPLFQGGILGTLVSLIEVAPQDMAAIEAALGVASDSVLFKDSSLAEEALRRLRNKELGRSSLMISESTQGDSADGATLTKATQNTPSTQATLPPGAIAWALDRISAPAPILEIITPLLERTALVPTLEMAFELRHSHSWDHLHFVTEAGEFLNANGLLSGGADSKKKHSLLLRRSQIQELSQELIELEHEISERTEAKQAVTEKFEHLCATIQELRQEGTLLQERVVEAQSNVRLTEREKVEVTRRLERLNQELISLQEEQAAAQEKIALQEADITRLGTAKTEQSEELQQAKGALQTLATLLEEATSLLNESRLQVATQRQEERSLTARQAPLEAQMKELKRTILQRTHEAEQARSRILQLDQEGEELSRSKGGWQQTLASISETLRQQNHQRSERQAELQEQQEKLRTTQQHFLQLEQKRSQAEVRSAEQQMKSESLQEHLQRHYQIEISGFRQEKLLLLQVIDQRQGEKKSFSTASIESEKKDNADTNNSPFQAITLPTDESLPWETITTMVEEIREKIDLMGPVNLEAIQEFEELEQRYTFLETQNNDLITAKQELLETITKINKTTRELFSTTFEKVRGNFQEMFRELFGGGKANLLLLDENDPLESGIDIIARPPGKQLQSISLLSGGEKTMTAVALLFAIYMVKPSPFCVLDEMDAPLDDSNIGRFIKLLDRFIAQSQFFVITHNKRTMSRADMLYGVTMEERGVTKLVSVNFSEGKYNKSNEE